MAHQIDFDLVCIAQVVLILRLALLRLQPGLVVVSSNLSLHVRLNVSTHCSLVLAGSLSHCAVICVKIRAKGRLTALDGTHWLSSETLSRLVKLLHL